MGAGWYWKLSVSRVEKYDKIIDPSAEGAQKIPKVSIKNDGHLRRELDTFGETITNQSYPKQHQTAVFFP
jgi:hypothetical protein